MVTKVEETRCSEKDVRIGDNRMKDDWTRGGGMNIPRMRRPEDQSATAGLMMEVWASVASWFLKPDGNNSLATTCSSNSSVTNSTVSNNGKNNNCRISSDIPSSFGPTICTAIRCTVPACNCECFTPGKLHIRCCESCSHGWVPHALDKLGFQPFVGQTPVEPVQPNVAFDIASLVLYGCQALPVQLKILLDRLFSVLQKEEVTQILRGFGWSHEEYIRGYRGCILQEAPGVLFDKWSMCSPEEEPLVLQQFLRFGETRAFTQQLLLHGLGDLRHLPRVEADLKKMVEKSISKGLSSKHEDGRSSKSSQNTHSSSNKLRNQSSPTNVSPSLLPPPPYLGKFPPLLPPSHLVHSTSPQQQRHPHSSLNFVKLPQTGLTCTPITSTNGPIGSPPNNSVNMMNMSPLNKLQNMQPFDFRKIASGVFPSSKPSAERRRHSETSDTSQTGLNLCVTSPSTLLPPPSLPIPQSVTSTSTYPPSTGCKSPAVDFMSKASSEFGSEDGDDEEESSQSALNLSKDATNARMPRQRHAHSRKTSTPMKRQWGSSNLPLNLGTQLINPATGKKRVQCNVCLKTFCDKGALKIHFSAVHLREMHKCTVEGCNMMFSSRRSRNRHSANPNPKLHSPHLRRKISPHDGRSAQAHPILMPPLQAAGLNPLSFGTFPLLTPPDLRHQLSSLDLQQFEFNSARMSSDNQDEYMDDDDEDGIVVDGGGVDDDENDSETNSGGKAESTKSKHTKMSESDMEEDGVSNTDSNESLALFDHQPTTKEENDLTSKNVHKRKSQKPTRCTLRTVPSDDEALSDDFSADDMIFVTSNATAAAAAAAVAAAAASADSPGVNANATTPKSEHGKEWDLRKAFSKSKSGESSPTAETDADANPENTTTFGKKRKSDDENEFEESECLNLSKTPLKERVNDVKHSKERDTRTVDEQSERGESASNKENDAVAKRASPSSEREYANERYARQQSMNTLQQLENFSKRKLIDEPDKNENYEREPLNYAMDVEASSPTRSHESSASTASCDSDENSENHVFGHFEDGNFIGSMDIPLDKDNPRKCTACGKVFQNHFGVKTHFQNVHLKLMHKCVIEGCNAAFPSKRSRDRHSNNSNLHRKLLSTSDNTTPYLPDSPPFGVASNTANMHNDFLSRLYGDSQNLSMNSPLSNAPPQPPPLPPPQSSSAAAAATTTTTTNGDLIGAHPSLMIPPLGALPFAGINPFAPHIPMLNGKSDESQSPLKSPPRLLVYNIEEDMPTPDQDNVFHCRFCSKPFTETSILKDHYERNHLNEMYRCKVPGCLRVFSSRTKRNIHSENRLIHGKEMTAS